MKRPRRAPRTPGVKRRSIFWRARRIVFVFLLVGTVGVSGLWRWMASIEVPKTTNAIDLSTLVCDARAIEPGSCNRENSVAQFASDQIRIPIAYAEIPKVTIDALIAGEDRQFFEHRGIDPIGIGRAIYHDLKTRSGNQGASTITQQYIKVSYLTADRSAIRKVKESILAMKIEKEKSKERILEEYLNLIPFGRRAYGIEAASIAYFGHGAATLSLSESAYLVGRIREPFASDVQVVERRRQSVINAMVEEKMITQKQADAAIDAPPTIVPAEEFNNLGSIPQDLKDVGYSYLMELARTQAYELLGGSTNVTEGGYRIYTTINPDWQRLAYHSIFDVMNQTTDPNGALVTLDSSGAIKAMVGGRNFDRSRINLAIAMETGGAGRPAGSTFKPIVLAEYVQQGYSLNSDYDAPPILELEDQGDDGETWTVNNFNDTDFKRVTVLEATKRSVNTAYAQIMQKVTPERVVAMSQVLGLNGLEPNPSLVLGTGEVQVRDMTAAYLTFANGGEYKAPYLVHRIEDAQGKVVYDVNKDAEHAPRRVIDEQVAKTVSYALSQVVADGSGGRAGLVNTAAAGKTGTTQNSRDAWFIGSTCKVTTGLWLGYAEGAIAMLNVHGQESVNGSNFPAEIWGSYMKLIADNDRDCSFPQTDAGKVKEVGLNLPRIVTTTSSTLPGQPPVNTVIGAVTPTTARQGFRSTPPVTTPAATTPASSGPPVTSQR